MKANLKGLDGIKTLLLAHGEKAGIAIVAGLALMLIYKSLIGREQLPANRQADDLRQQIDMARTNVTKFTWEDAVANHADQVRDGKPLAQSGAGTIDREAYVNNSWKIPWNAPLVPPTVLRSDPQLLVAEQLEAYGGSGLLAFTNEQIRRQRQLEEAAEQARLDQQREAERQREREEADRRGRNDPAEDRDPNRRPAPSRAASTGVALQGDEQVVTEHWAEVVALVPIKDQIGAFRDALENARDYDPAADYPNYLGYFVQRAEVEPGEELQWTNVRVYNGKGDAIGGYVSNEILYGRVGRDGEIEKQGVVTDWAQSYDEVVAADYLDPNGVLLFPLPPLVGRDWGLDLPASHSEVPLRWEAVESEELPPEVDLSQTQQPEEDGDSGIFRGTLGGDAARGGRPSQRGMPGPMGARPGGPMHGMPGMGMPSRGMAPGATPYGGMPGRGMAGRGMAGPGQRAGQASIMPRVDHWLLRFFDFSVEPGKKYKYRVRMVLQDPNQSSSATGRVVSIDALDKDVIARVREQEAERSRKPPIPYRLTEWSEPSRTASIPLAGTVHVAAADAPNERSFTSEPEIELLVQSFSADEAGKHVQAAVQEEFRRGAVANLVADTEVLEGRWIVKYDDFDFRTGTTVVDIRGGQRLSRDLESEARVLLMDPAGQLFVQEESDDADAVARHQATFDESEDTGRGGFVPGRRGAGPGPGGAFPGRGRGR